jgi:MoxR-like ATPase
MTTQDKVLSEKVARAIAQVLLRVFGYDKEIRLMFATSFAGAHVLIEGVPGLAKTLIAKTITDVFTDAILGRVQGSPDLMPGEILGFEVFNPKTGEWEARKGPIQGVHILFYDEMNRSSTKTNASTLQALQEGSVTVAGKQIPLLKPFWAIATENPIEQEGTFQLPEAQADRFGAKIVLRYVSEENELTMLESDEEVPVEKVMSIADLVDIKTIVKANGKAVPNSLKRYIIRLVRSTRPQDPRFDLAWGVEASDLRKRIAYGAGPRAEKALLSIATGWAFTDGRDKPDAADVKEVFAAVLRHRFVLTPFGSASRFDVDVFLENLLKKVPLNEGELSSISAGAKAIPQGLPETRKSVFRWPRLWRNPGGSRDDKAA